MSFSFKTPIKFPVSVIKRLTDSKWQHLDRESEQLIFRFLSNIEETDPHQYVQDCVNIKLSKVMDVIEEARIIV